MLLQVCIYLLNPSTTVCHLYFSLGLVSNVPAQDEGACTTCPRAGLRAGGGGCCVPGAPPTGMDRGMNDPLFDMINDRRSVSSICPLLSSEAPHPGTNTKHITCWYSGRGKDWRPLIYNKKKRTKRPPPYSICLSIRELLLSR